MEEKNLHSAQLEGLIGPVTCEVVRQEDGYRMVHLRNQEGVSRTLGLTRFYELGKEQIATVHRTIMEGGFLGRSLVEAGLDIEKHYVAKYEVELPEWLKKEFATELGNGLLLHARITLNNIRGVNSANPYAEIFEVIPPDLREHFEQKAPYSDTISEDLEQLVHYAGLRFKNKNPDNTKRCIVIGAGPGGIVAVKELLEQGLQSVICLEQSQEIGGTFARSYDQLILTSSVTFSMFSDFWVGEGKDHHFWSKKEAVEYWTDYARHFGVLDHIRLGAQVEDVKELPGGTWRIRLQTGEILECDHLILAIGNNNIPKFPEWSKKITEIPFSHSKDYKNAEPFKGKRVMIVGGGESGSDVAYEISQVAAKCWVSLRASTGWVVPRRRGGHAADVSTHRGIWDLPREYGRKLSPFVLKLERARKDPVFDALAELNEKITAQNGIWGIFGTKTLALPKAIAYHGCKVVRAIEEIEEGGRKLTSASGEVLDDVDTIVFCTGYENRIDFMPDPLKRCNPRKMYQHLFKPGYGDRVAWIGWARPGFGSQFPIMEMQARYTALILSGKMALPEKSEMARIIEGDEEAYRKQFEDNAEHIPSLVDYHRYMNNLAKIIGCYPPIIKYFFLRPSLWMHLMYGPTQATQFRLRGPGKKVGTAHEIIRKLPLSTFNHIVKAGLRGRVQYGLKGILPGFLKATP